MSEEINENEHEEELSNLENQSDVLNNETDAVETITKITGMYKEWFLDYASYVILERAVPSLEDGLKPVQRRIMHSMKDLDDGRYNKVANIVGHTMQYHPHGDASIADAMVQIGQKELLIDMQGNWGNILTGDRAAASRYIEARLSKFALDVVFNPKTTDWKMSYDGRDLKSTIPWNKQDISTIGYHYYMTPEIALEGIHKMNDAQATKAKMWSYKNYPDISNLKVFNNG